MKTMNNMPATTINFNDDTKFFYLGIGATIEESDHLMESYSFASAFIADDHLNDDHSNAKGIAEVNMESLYNKDSGESSTNVIFTIKNVGGKELVSIKSQVNTEEDAENFAAEVAKLVHRTTFNVKQIMEKIGDLWAAEAEKHHVIIH